MKSPGPTYLQLATLRKTEADTDIELINAGVIDTQEARVRPASREDGPYSSLDLNEAPPTPPLRELRTAGGAEVQYQHR